MGQTRFTKGEIIWQVLIYLCVILTALEAPFSFAFQTKLQNWQVWADLFVSSLFLGDVIYQVRDRLKRPEKYKKAKDIKLKNTLLGIDIIAAIPFDVIAYFFGMSKFSVLNLVRLCRMLRIIKLFTMFKGTITIIPKQVQLFALLVCSVIAIHWIACGWVIIHPAEGSRVDYYIKSIYWAVTTLTTIGYGDITPTTNGGRLYTMVIMILGVGVYGIVIGNVSRMLAASDRYKEQSKEKLSDLMTFMKYYNVPDRVQSTVFSYYNHLLSKRLSDSDTKIISDLPHALQQELRTYMNMKLIQAVPIFKNCSHSCLKDVAAALEQKYYAPNQNIIRIGEIGQEMFIIGHGKVDVILSDGSHIATLHEGQFFGESALLEETTRNADVRSSGYCDLYILAKEDFVEIIKKHPELLANIESVTKKRASDKKSSDSDSNSSSPS